MSTNPQDGSQPSGVLVHGGFVDGSGWHGVYDFLKDTSSVRIVNNPLLCALAILTPITTFIASQFDTVILLGHFD